MVLGLRSKSKKGPSFAVDFYLQVQDIKPWPRADNVKSTVQVILQWQRGEKRTGSTRAVTPEDTPDGGRIVFHESFRLPATLYREESRSSKVSAPWKFQKKCVIFSLFESSLKGQKIGTAVLDLADYAIADALVCTSIPLALARKNHSGVSPSLFISIGPFSKKNVPGRIGSVSGHGKSGVGTSATCVSVSNPISQPESREALVAALMSDEDDEIAAFTDDDEDQSPGSSSPSLQARVLGPASETSQSLATSSSPVVKEAAQSPIRSSVLSSEGSIDPSSEIQLQKVGDAGADEGQMIQPPALPAKSAASTPVAAASAYLAKRGVTSKETSSSRGSSPDLSSEPFSPDSDGFFTPTSTGGHSPSVLTKSPVGKCQLSLSASTLRPTSAPPSTGADITLAGRPVSSAQDVRNNPEATSEQRQVDMKSVATEQRADVTILDFTMETKLDPKLLVAKANASVVSVKKTDQKGQRGELVGLSALKSDQNYDGVERGVEDKEPSRGKASKTIDDNKRPEERGEYSVLQEARARLAKGVDGEKITERFENKALDEAIKKLEGAEARIRLLEADLSKMVKNVGLCEGELTDIAAAEVALYSVVPEHGGSAHKVHAPARRLARLYAYACRVWSPERRAISARNSVAGIVLVVRGCGHDVPRLTFWWSNVVVLKEMISQACGTIPSNPTPASPGGAKPLRSPEFSAVSENGLWRSSILVTQDSRRLSSREGASPDWEEPATYTTALERVEVWIHGRVMECVWWQAMAPPMQRSMELSPISSPRPNSPDWRLIGREPMGPSELGDGRQGNISVEIWKKALLDVHKRLCPVRAAGHDCGCLHSLMTLVMEQCAARLDVAIFNALLRDVSEFVATDPISDPIGDPNVLPLAPGKLTFGDGAQLKNAVGTWSNWLAGVLGTGDASTSGEVYNHENDVGSVDEVDKGTLYFTFLRATADLLMLPKDILMDKSVRKEVCPALSLPLIRRVLSIFEPDEFFPDPVSPSLLAALNAEVAVERRRQGDVEVGPSFVAMASAPPTTYIPPPAAYVQEIIGKPNDANRLSRSSSILRKGYTSDDELEDLESPPSLMPDSSSGILPRTPDDRSSLIREISIFGRPRQDSTGGAGYTGVLKRFSLLREVWASH